jgi:uncharacterized membrane protein
MTITLGFLYFLTGLMFAAFAVLSALDAANAKRWRNTLFWGLLAVSFLFGDRLTDFANGALAITLALLAGLGALGLGRPATTSPQEREAGAARWGHWLFAPALAIPIVTLAGSLLLKGVVIGGHPLIDPRQATWISLGFGVLVAMAMSLVMFRPPPTAPLQEGRRLIDAIGWAAILPQALAALGAVFALAGVGQVIGGLASQWIPVDSRLAVVCAYTFGMAGFTILTGNGFAAFPVMTAGIGLPLIVRHFGGDPVIMGAIGMLSGFCGTLVTPMAANFNIVPVRLLELPDQYAVIKAQIPTALVLLIANTLLMYFLVFRF